MKNSIAANNGELYVNGVFVDNLYNHSDVREKYRVLSGRVCLGGLGLGLDLEYILSFSEVRELVVYEIVPEFKERLKVKDDRLTVIIGDFNSADKDGFDFVIDTCYPPAFVEELQKWEKGCGEI